MYYFGARYYDSNLGRFTGVDPIRENEPYSYVRNNPLNLVDPTGMDDIDEASVREGFNSVGYLSTFSYYGISNREYSSSISKVGVRDDYKEHNALYRNPLGAFILNYGGSYSLSNSLESFFIEQGFLPSLEEYMNSRNDILDESSIINLPGNLPLGNTILIAGFQNLEDKLTETDITNLVSYHHGIDKSSRDSEGMRKHLTELLNLPPSSPIFIGNLAEYYSGDEMIFADTVIWEYLDYEGGVNVRSESHNNYFLRSIKID